MAFAFAGQWGPEPVVDRFGNAVYSATFRVLTTAGAEATVYTDRTKATTVAQPLDVDGEGNATFYAAPGRYTVELTAGGSGTSFPVGVVPDAEDVEPANDVAASFGATATLVSLTGHGAVGDGAADDTAALRSAVDEHLATGLPIYVEEGTYRVISTITVNYASSKATVFRLFGLNSGTGPFPRTIIRYEGTGPLFDVQLDSTSMEGIDISGLSFEQLEASPNYQTGIAFQVSKVEGVDNYQRKIRLADGACRGMKSVLRMVGVDNGTLTPISNSNYFGPTYIDNFGTYLTRRPVDIDFATANLFNISRSLFHGCAEGGVYLATAGLIQLHASNVHFESCEPGAVVVNTYHQRLAFDNVSGENNGSTSGWGMIARGAGDVGYNVQLEVSNRLYDPALQPPEFRLPRGTRVRASWPIVVSGESITIETPDMVTPTVSDDPAYNQADKYTLVRTSLRPGPTYAGSKVFTNLAGQHGTSKGTSPRSGDLPAPIRATHVGATRIIANTVDTFTAPSAGFLYITWIAKAAHATNNGFSTAKVTIDSVDVVIPTGFRWRPHTGVYTLMVPIASGQVLSNVELTQYNTDWQGPALVTFSAATEPAAVCANGFPRVLRRSATVPASGTYTLTDKGQAGPGQPFAVRTKLLFNGGRTGVFECVTRGDGQNADRVRTDIVNSLTADITVGTPGFPAHEDMVSLLLTNNTAADITAEIETVYQS